MMKNQKITEIKMMNEEDDKQYFFPNGAKQEEKEINK